MREEEVGLENSSDLKLTHHQCMSQTLLVAEGG